MEDDGYSVGRPDLDPSTLGCRDQEASTTLEVFALTKERILITGRRTEGLTQPTMHALRRVAKHRARPAIAARHIGSVNRKTSLTQ
jgi:hypothetical protein